MNILYIDYTELCTLRKAPKKRILFLRAIKSLIDLDRNFIEYDKLGLCNEDINPFITFLKGSHYKQFFIPLDNGVEIVKHVDGKIIVGTDLLLQDLKEFYEGITQIPDLTSLLREVNDEEVKNGISKIFTEVNRLILSPKVFIWWLFKYISIPLIPYSKEGLKIYQMYLKSLGEKEIKKIFNLDILAEEVRCFPNRKKKGEIEDMDMQQIINFLGTITRNIEVNYPPPKDWFDLRHTVNKLFQEIHTANAAKNLFLPSPNQKLFLIEKGNTSRNPAISRHNNKIVLFNDAEPLSKKLRAGDVILGTIKKELEYFKTIIVNPEKVLGEDEAKSFLERGIDAAPSRNKILERLEHLRGKSG